MPLFASFVALSGRILRGNGTRPEWVDNLLADGEQNVAYSDGVSAEGIPAVTYSVTSGSLPPGLTLNSSSGALTGTPSAGGNYSFTITASNGVGSVEQSYSKVILLPAPSSISWLVIAGGGRSAGGPGFLGGGGAGGYRSSWNGETSGGGAGAEAALSVSPSTNYTVTVGGSETNSTLGSITSTRGGRAATAYPYPTGSGNSGGSGSGGGVWRPYHPYSNGFSGISGQGRPGAASNQYAAEACAGGGGAANPGGGIGYNAWSGGGGGAGRASTITGTSVTRAGGGGGSGYNGGGGGGSGGGGAGARVSNTSSGSPGSANTGGGGGGSYGSGSSNGGSGLVVIRYSSNYRSPNIGAGLVSSETIVGGDRVIQFTGGSDTISW